MMGRVRARVLNLGGADLRGRIAAASAWEPLSALAAPQRAELAAALDRASAFEDLPGKWQAAVLRAEATREGAEEGVRAASPGRCCGCHAHRQPPRDALPRSQEPVGE